MRAPFILFLASLSGLAVTLALPAWSDLIIIAAPATAASLYLLVRAVRTRGSRTGWVILDGSNVMHWNDGTPQLATLRAVLDHVTKLGMTPGVVFDANAGHLLFGKFTDDRTFARRLKLPRDRVMVVQSGEPADPTILTAARDLGAQIISNDRFRDWRDEFPELDSAGQLISGGVSKGQVWLTVEQ